MTTQPAWQRVLDFYIGPLDADGLASAEMSARWWRKDPAFDTEIADKFGDDVAAASEGERNDWLQDPHGRVAWLLLIDQFRRNMYRDSAGMYEKDVLALQVARKGLERGDDNALPLALRCFLYMPLMHSEDLAAQDRCVELMQTMLAGLDDRVRERMAGYGNAAIAHRDIVARFGRFPHRNEILARESTDEEIAFLEQPGSSF